MSATLQEFLKSGIEAFPDPHYGDGFRCSVYLKDGVFLPCVVLRQTMPNVQLAMRRFEQERKGKGIFGSGQNGYEQIVKSFVTSGNRINNFDIASVEPSRFAMPLSLLRQVRGETWMSCTGFVLEMQDGSLHPFGTSFDTKFFALPEQYGFGDVVRVHNHAYVSPDGELKALIPGLGNIPEDYDPATLYRARPYFICYYDA
jgi:hypothetical protein